MREELGKLGWTKKDLPEHRKGDKAKVKIARRLRTETTMTLKWIAERLEMGSSVHAANRIYECRSEK